MSSFKDLLDAIGISGPSAVAGFSGGLVSVFFNQKMKPFEIAGALIGGTLTANWIGPVISEAAHAPLGATCFVIGLGGLYVAGYCVTFLRKKMPGEGTSGGSSDASSI